MSEPNYPGYTVDELYDARDHIDQASYPDRHRQILEEIERRVAGKDEVAEDATAPPSVIPLAQVTFWVLVLAVIAGAVFGPGQLLRLRVVRPIEQAVDAELPGQKIEVAIETEDEGQRIVVVMIDSRYAGSSRRRKEKAREIAGIALASHPQRDEVYEITVIYREDVGRAVASQATDRSYSYSPDELDVESASPGA